VARAFPVQTPSSLATSRLHEVTVEAEVPFHDVDAQRIVWHGHYAKYFELARTALLRSRDLDIGSFIGTRFGFLVIDSRCRYVFPLRYGERMRIAAWFQDLRRRLVIGYEITNLSHDRRSARGQTTLGVVDPEGRLLLEVPDEILQRIDPGPREAR
jgi:acyl-CoA thioester hydrolase